MGSLPRPQGKRGASASVRSRPRNTALFPLIRAAAAARERSLNARAHRRIAHAGTRDPDAEPRARKRNGASRWCEQLGPMRSGPGCPERQLHASGARWALFPNDRAWLRREAPTVRDVRRGHASVIASSFTVVFQFRIVRFL